MFNYSSEIAKNIPCDCFALVFGINTFISLIIQSFLTATFNGKGGFEFGSRAQVINILSFIVPALDYQVEIVIIFCVAVYGTQWLLFHVGVCVPFEIYIFFLKAYKININCIQVAPTTYFIIFLRKLNCDNKYKILFFNNKFSLLMQFHFSIELFKNVITFPSVRNMPNENIRTSFI